MSRPIGMTGEEAYAILRKYIPESPGEGIYMKVEVMDQSDYDALAIKNPNTMYMIRG